MTTSRLTPKCNATNTICIAMLALTFMVSVSFAFIVKPHHLQTTRRNLQLRMSGASPDLSDVRIMVNGMPGPMATAAAEACLRKGLLLAPVAMTGPDVPPSTITVTDADTGRSGDVKLVPSTNIDEMDDAVAGMRAGCGEDNLLVIDFTHPSAVNSNALWYAENRLPFVMGTTGGDREKLTEDVSLAKCPAVIAPNMGKQIVAMQAALEDLAVRYPGAFEGYELEVTESHQKTKADTSGTAKDVIGSLKTLSADSTFDAEEDVKKLRSDEDSMGFGVPEDSLNGHAFHTYTLTSADGSVKFALEHNVCGRRVYAEGTADAVKFLAKKIRENKDGKIYTMINVLEEGAME